MIYEIVWNTDGHNPGEMDLPKYVIVNNNASFNFISKEEYPDPPVFHIAPSDFPEIDLEEELSDIMTDIFDWCIVSLCIVDNDTFTNDMKHFNKEGFVSYEYV